MAGSKPKPKPKPESPQPQSDVIGDLRAQYSREAPRAIRLMECMTAEVNELLERKSVPLGVPIEFRVKDWASLAEKIGRKSLQISNVTELPDLVGLRLILLFRRDLERADELIKDNFDVVSIEDTAQRLEESQFGYQSQHYVVRLKTEWQSVPRYSDLGDLTAEIQVRTLAQHMWAAASHKLQYKREESVPLPLRRAIYRVSALLETVDLELDRVLSERSTYISSNLADSDADAGLNVDLVQIIAKELLPAENDDGENAGFDEVLAELGDVGITTARELRNLLASHLDRIMAADKKAIKAWGPHRGAAKERARRGVYFNFIGLIRQAMIEEFGEDKVRAIIRTFEDPSDADDDDDDDDFYVEDD